MQECPGCRGPINAADVSRGACPACGKPLAAEELAGLAEKKVPPATLRPDPNIDSIGENPEGTLLANGSVEPPQVGLKDEDLSGVTVELGRTTSSPSPGDTAAPTDTMSGPTLTPAESLKVSTDKRAAADAGSTQAGETMLHESAPEVSVFKTVKLEDHSQTSGISGSHGTIIRPRNLKKAGDPAPLEADYELLEQIGEGGMGVVYRARQCSMNRDVAIKQIKGAHADAETRAKFLTEAAVTGELAHPNIVPVHDLGANDKGDLFYAMKVVAGDCWLTVLQQKTREENVDILLRVADAVAFAHSHNIVHRDLKPENVMLGRFGEVLVMDWGLAGKLQLGVKLPSGGTPGYLAPEMAVDLLVAMDVDTGGLPQQPIGKHSDIYLLGAILFEIVTGLPPHFSEGRQTAMYCVQRAARNELLPTDSKKDELLAIAYRAMATHIEDRFPSVADFQKSIREYQDHAQSILLASKAEASLAEAKVGREYESLAKAQYGFQDAIELWEQNELAIEGLAEAKLVFAETAYRNQDYDLGMSLLDRQQPEQSKWYDRLLKARKARDARRTRLRAATIMTIVLLITVCGGAMFFGVQQKQFAAKEANLRAVAETEKKAAEEATKAAEEARDREAIAREQEELARKDADSARQRAETARKAAEDAADRERVAREAEADARRLAQQNEADAKYGTFVSEIALADARLHANDPGRALEILDDIQVRAEATEKAIPDWEWHYLHHRCHTEIAAFDVGGGNPVVATTPNGDQCVTAAVDRLQNRIVVRLWRAGKLERDKEVAFPTTSDRTAPTAAAISQDGRLVFVGFRAAKNSLWMWNTHSGEITEQLIHNRDVRTLAFSDKQNWLLTAGRRSYSGDRVAVRLWKVEGSVLEEEFLHGLLPSGRPRADGHQPPVVKQVRTDPSGLRMAEINNQNQLLIRTIDPAGTGSSVSRTPLKVPGAVTAVFLPNDPNRLLVATSNRVFVAQVDDDNRVSADEERDVGSPHTAILDLDISPDGKTFVTAGEDRTLVVWDLQRLSPQKTLRGHEEAVTSCRFARQDGKDMLISVDAAGTMRRFLPDEYLDEVTVNASAGVNYVVGNVSENGDFYAVGQRLGRVSIHDRAGHLLSTISVGHASPAEMKVFYSNAIDGLVTTSADGSIWTWSAEGKPLKQLAPPGRDDATNQQVAISPNGRYFVRRADKRYDIWQLDGNQQFSVSPEGNPSTTQIAIDSQGNPILMVGSESVFNFRLRKASGKQSGPTVEFKDSEGRSRYAFVGVREGDDAVVAVNESEIKLWSDEQTLISRVEHPFKDRIVKGELRGDTLLLQLHSPEDIWVANTTQNLQAWTKRTPPPALLQPAFTEACLDAAGRQVHLLGADRVVRTWDLTTSAVNSSDVLGAVNEAASLAGASGGRCITYSPSGNASVWDLSESQELARVSSDRAMNEVHFLGPHPESNRRHVLTFSADRVLRLWDVESVLRGETEVAALVWQKLNQRDRDLRTIAVGPQAWHIVVAQRGPSDSVELVGINLITGVAESIATLDLRASSLTSIAWAGDIVAVASHEGVVHSVVKSTGSLASTLHARGDIKLVRLSPDAAVLAIVTEAASVQLQAIGAAGVWPVGGVEIKTSDKLARAINVVTFSKSGKRLLVGDEDGNIGLWHVDVDQRTQRELMTLPGHKRPMRSLSFSADGRTLLGCDPKQMIVRFTSGWD